MKVRELLKKIQVDSWEHKVDLDMHVTISCNEQVFELSGRYSYEDENRLYLYLKEID